MLFFLEFGGAGRAGHRAAADRLRAPRRQGGGQPRLHRASRWSRSASPSRSRCWCGGSSRRWAYTLGAALLGLYAVLLALDAAAGARRRHVLPHRRGGAPERHAQPLHHGQHRQARADPLRAAAARRRDARLGPRALRRRAADAGLGLWAPAALSLGAVGAARSRSSGRCASPRAGRSAPRPAPAPLVHPLAAVRRFAAQPRLRLAWAIAFARSAFWMTFFIYVPILMRRGRPRRRRRRPRGGRRQPHALQQLLRPRLGRARTRCAGCSAAPSSPPPR